MEDSYKIRKFRLAPEKESDPSEVECCELTNKLCDVVNGGNFSVPAVINALSNLFTAVSSDLLLNGKLSFSSFLQGYLASFEDKLKQMAEIKDAQNVSSAIDRLKESANLK